MATADCPICDMKLELPDPEHVTGLSGISMPTDTYLARVHGIEAAMKEHVEQHSTEEWVLAFQQADAYIEMVEAEVAALERRLAEIALAGQRVAQDPGPTTQLYRQRPDNEPVPAAPRWPNGRPDHDPNQTLIPMIPTSERPAGMVGRKT